MTCPHTPSKCLRVLHRQLSAPGNKQGTLLQCGMLGTWGGVGAYIAGQLPFGQDPSANDRRIWQICAYVCAGLTGLLLIFTLVLIRRIKACAVRHWL